MIEELLPVGKENAITTKELLKISGIKSKRTLTAAVQRERKAGALICSFTDNGGGYYMPATSEEVRGFIFSMRSRALNNFRSIKAARLYLQQIEGQESLDTTAEKNEGR